MADTTITNLPNAAALTGTERVPMDQGATTVDATTQAIANLAPGTNLTYDAATRLLSSSTGTDVTIPLVNTTAAGLIPHTWLTGADAAILPHIHGDIAGEVYEHVKAGASLSALTPYRIIGGVGDTDRVEVVAADAGNSNTMPASGILPGALANNADGHGAVAGVITGVNTAAYPPGTVLYVAVGGGLTATRPSANVQMVAVVGRQHATTGTVVPLIGPSLALSAYTGAYGDMTGLPFIPASAGDVGADPAGTAASAVSAHVAASDPHTQYLRPTEVVAGTNVTVDTTTTPGSVIINSTATIFNPASPGAIGGTTPAPGTFSVVYSPRATLTASGSTYTLDAAAANEFVAGATVAGNITVTATNLASVPTNAVWRAVFRFAYSSGAITFSAPAGFTAKPPATTPTLTAGRTYDVIASVVGGGTVLDYRYGGDGYTT